MNQKARSIRSAAIIQTVIMVVAQAVSLRSIQGTKRKLTACDLFRVQTQANSLRSIQGTNASCQLAIYSGYKRKLTACATRRAEFPRPAFVRLLSAAFRESVRGGALRNDTKQ